MIAERASSYMCYSWSYIVSICPLMCPVEHNGMWVVGDIACLSYNPRVLMIVEVGPVGFVLSQPYYTLDADASAIGRPQTGGLVVCGC